MSSNALRSGANMPLSNCGKTLQMPEDLEGSNQRGCPKKLKLETVNGIGEQFKWDKNLVSPVFSASEQSPSSSIAVMPGSDMTLTMEVPNNLQGLLNGQPKKWKLKSYNGKMPKFETDETWALPGCSLSKQLNLSSSDVAPVSNTSRTREDFKNYPDPDVVMPRLSSESVVFPNVKLELVPRF